MKELVYRSSGSNAHLVYDLTKEDQVDTVSLNMMRYNQINGIIPVQFTQSDDQRQLIFDISGKLQASTLLERQIQKQRLYKILRGIVRGMLNAEDYRLLPESIMLSRESIFVDIRTGETELLCIPLKDLPNQNVDMKEFLTKLVYDAHVDDYGYIAQLMAYLKDQTVVDLTDFEVFLDKMMQEQSTPVVDQNPPIPVKIVNDGVESKGGQQQEVAPQTQEVRPETDKGSKQEKKRSFFDKLLKGNDSKEKKEKKKSKPEKSIENDFGFAFPDQQERVIEQHTPEAVRTETERSVQERESISYGETVYISRMEDPSFPDVDLRPYLIRQDNQEKVRIDCNNFIVGRSKKEAHYRLEDPERGVGRTHAKIIYQDGQFYIADLDSANGTYLNGKKLKPFEENLLNPGAKLVFSDIVVVFSYDAMS